MSLEQTVISKYNNYGKRMVDSYEITYKRDLKDGGRDVEMKIEVNKESGDVHMKEESSKIIELSEAEILSRKRKMNDFAGKIREDKPLTQSWKIPSNKEIWDK